MSAVSDSAAVPEQRASFLNQLWNVDSAPGEAPEALFSPKRVLATVYEIGGPLTGVLSKGVNKQLALIPHVASAQ